jgi:hypothetical protein
VCVGVGRQRRSNDKLNLPIRLKPLQFRSDLFRQRGQVHAFATHLRPRHLGQVQ